MFERLSLERELTENVIGVLDKTFGVVAFALFAILLDGCSETCTCQVNRIIVYSR